MKQTILRVSASVAACLGITGCYVVPIAPAGQVPHSTAQVPAPVQPMNLSARLYPTNDEASRLGVINGTIVNQLDGRGVFSFGVAGETYQGEATRHSGTRNGTANAGGNRGGFMTCTYSMNSAVQGSGRCTHSGGGIFTLHIGQ